MARDIHLVFSSAPAGVSEREFSDWYERHIGEILATPGFASSRRYWLGQGVAGRPPIVHRHLSIYELDRPPGEALAELSSRVEAGQLALPPWFGEIRFASYDGFALEASELVLPDHLYLVLSAPPASMAVDEFYAWYRTHLRENLTADGFEAGWRFRLAAVTVAPGAAARPVHAALYQVALDLPQLRAGLDAAFQAGQVDIPEWMAEAEFISMDCIAISAAQSAAVAG